MDEEEIKRRIDAAVDAATKVLMKQISEQQAEIDKWKKKFSDEETARINVETETKQLRANEAERVKEAAKLKVKFARDNITGLLDGAVKAKKITPAKKERIVKTFGIDDDARVVTVEPDEIRELFSLGEEDRTVLGGGGSSAAGGGGGGEEGDPNRTHKDVFKEVEHRISMARSKDASMSYHQAMRSVFSADKELHKEYLNTTPPERVAAGGSK